MPQAHGTAAQVKTYRQPIRNDGEYEIDRLVGLNIRTRRIILGLTQDALATKLKITFQQLQKYETGANRVSASRLAQIAWFMHCEPADLFKGVEQFRHNFTGEGDASQYQDIAAYDPSTKDLQVISLLGKLPPPAYRAFIAMLKAIGNHDGPNVKTAE
jgi:transcriptional regulator with XRE-family HTH domain